MAYKGRGSMRKTTSGGSGRGFRSHRMRVHRGPRVYMFRDYNQYLMSQLISFIVLGIIIFISVLICMFSYESQYIYDPIISAKNTFSDLQFGGFIICILLLIFAVIKRKTSKHAFKLIIGTLIGLITIVMITMFGFFKFENEYNEQTFAEMYSESYIKVNLTGDKKGLFLQECDKLQENFRRKVLVITVLEYCIIFIDVYLLFTELKLQKRYAEIEKENEVLFDEEENVKI